MCDYVPYYLRKNQTVRLPVCLSVRPSVRPSVCLSVCLYVCLSVYPSARLSVRLDKIYLTLFKIKHGLVSFELGELKLSDHVMLCILDMVIVNAGHT